MGDRKLLKNKIVASLLLFISFVLMVITGEAMAFILALIIGVPLFFSKENWIH